MRRAAMRGIASNGTITAISTLVAPRAPRLVASIPPGAVIRGEEGKFPFAGVGDAGSVAMDGSGRVYWSFAEAWPSVDAPAYPYLVSLDPGI